VNNEQSNRVYGPIILLLSVTHRNRPMGLKREKEMRILKF
jgi:hypothetical protein